MVRLLCLLVCLCFINVSIAADEELVQTSITKLFSLWTLPCSQWLSAFTTDAVFYHPMFPNALKQNQLFDFCQTNQLNKPALFRQDGQIRLTVSGNTTSSPLYHAMVPYVYGQVENGNNNSLFINSGYEYVQLVRYQPNETRIKTVVEFFNRASLPFTWPPNQ